VGQNTQGQLGIAGAGPVSALTLLPISPQAGAGAITWRVPLLTEVATDAGRMRYEFNAGLDFWAFSPSPGNRTPADEPNHRLYRAGSNSVRQLDDGAIPNLVPPSWGEVPAIFASDDIDRVATGFGRTMVIMGDGSVIGRGFNFFGELGNGAFANQPTWVQMAQGRRMRRLTSSPMAYHQCGIDTAFALWCWGRNEDGQVGMNAISVRQTTPVRVEIIP
jgi:hypothetical protein